MHPFSYEVIGKEKLRGAQEEGLRNQEIKRSGVPRNGASHRTTKTLLFVLSLLGVLGWLVR